MSPRCFSACFAAALLWIVPAAMFGQSAASNLAPAPGEYEVKAAFLYNFTRFVEWPDNPVLPAGTELRVCVLGEDPFGTSVDALQGKRVHERTIAVRRLENAERRTGCDVLFVSASESVRLDRVIDPRTPEFGVLTVSDMPGFAEAGGIIQMVLEHRRVRFEINVTAARRAGLSISSKLLRLARTLHQDR
jgi:hypothetical protein